MPSIILVLQHWLQPKLSIFASFSESCQHFTVSGPPTPAKEGQAVNTSAILQTVEDSSLCLKVLLPLGVPQNHHLLSAVTLVASNDLTGFFPSLLDLPSLLFSGIIYFNPTKTLSISNVLVELTLQVNIHKQKPSVITLVSSKYRCLSIIAPKILCGGGRRREHNVQCRMAHTCWSLNLFTGIL